MPYFELFQLLASSAYNQAFITRSMNYWLYDREYVYPRIAKGLCRGQWLEGVQQGAAEWNMQKIRLHLDEIFSENIHQM